MVKAHLKNHPEVPIVFTLAWYFALVCQKFVTKTKKSVNNHTDIYIED